MTKNDSIMQDIEMKRQLEMKKKALKDNKPQLGALELAIKNNPCSLCRAKRLPVCKCTGASSGGAGGGSGGSSGSSSEEKDNNSALSAGPSNLNTDTSEFYSPTLEASSSSFKQPQKEMIDPSKLEQIEKLLIIENDGGRGILKIRLKPGLTDDEQEQASKFLDELEAEFHNFKAELKAKGIAVDHFKVTANKHELIMRIPSPKYYDAFLQRLIAKSLLPLSVLTQKQHKDEKQIAQSAIPTAFTTKPTPNLTKKLEKEQLEKKKHTAVEKESEQQKEGKRFNPTPFSTKLIPPGFKSE